MAKESEPCHYGILLPNSSFFLAIFLFKNAFSCPCLFILLNKQAHYFVKFKHLGDAWGDQLSKEPGLLSVLSRGKLQRRKREAASVVLDLTAEVGSAPVIQV